MKLSFVNDTRGSASRRKVGGPTQTAEDESLSCFLIPALSSCVRPSESDPKAVRGCSSDASARLQTDSFLLPDTAGFSLYPLGILSLHKRLICFLPYMRAFRSIAVACLFGDQLSPLIVFVCLQHSYISAHIFVTLPCVHVHACAHSKPVCVAVQMSFKLRGS